jgi:2,4-dienoyl-CoA reductase-like NADH-dependent reductase (Old Yellow Enzyme family)
MHWDDERAESPPRGDIPVHLLREVEQFLRNSEIPATRFGREVMHDPRFVFDLRKGREPRGRTVTRVRAYLAAAL